MSRSSCSKSWRVPEPNFDRYWRGPSAGRDQYPASHAAASDEGDLTTTSAPTTHPTAHHLAGTAGASSASSPAVGGESLDSNRLLTTKQAAEYTTNSPHGLENLRCTGALFANGVVPARVGGKAGPQLLGGHDGKLGCRHQ